MGAGNAMNHTGPLCWWNWLVGLQLRPSGHSYVNVSRLDYETSLADSAAEEEAVLGSDVFVLLH